MNSFLWYCYFWYCYYSYERMHSYEWSAVDFNLTAQEYNDSLVWC